ICGRERNDVVGRVFWVPPMAADEAAGAELFEHVRTGGEVDDMELPLETGDGDCVLVDVKSRDLKSGGIQLEIADATARERTRLAERREAQRAMATRVAAEFIEMQKALQSSESERLRDAAQRANWIARELLAFTEQLVMRPSPVNLNELISGMQSEL